MNFFKNTKLLTIALIVLLAVSFLAVGCNNDKDTSGEDNQNEQENNNGKNTGEGVIEIAGSTSVQPVGEALAGGFMAHNPNIKVNYQGIGSSSGVKAADNATAQIGTASRNLKTEEEDWGLTKHVIAFDGVAVVVHTSNTVVNDLTMEQVQKIFKGEITNWNEVGGNNKEIIVVSREAGSGTRGAFEDIVGLEEKINDKKVSALTEDAIIAEGNGTVRANVAEKENAIGYLSLSYINDEIKTVKVNGVEPIVDNILTEKYPIYRPFLMLTKGELDESTQAFLDFAFSTEGQMLVASEGAIPVSLDATLEIAGSTSVQPVAELVADSFMAKYPGIKVNYQGIGSSSGVKAADNATAQIGTASRNLKTEEEDWGLTKHILAFDGVAVVVHPSNTAVNDLTMEQVQKIFKGEITNWSEVGGSNKEIIVISREAGSGTRGAFEDIVGLEEKINDKKVSALTSDAIIGEGNGTVRANVADKEDAIGYLSLSYINDEIKTVKVDGIEPSVENIKSEKYPVYRPFLMLTKGEIDIVTETFIDFAFSDKGQDIVSKKAIPVK